MKKLILTFLVTLFVFSGENAWGSNRVFMNSKSPEQRLQLVRFIRKEYHVDKFLHLIPKISPKERAWLKSELNSGDVPRVAKAHGSSEFNIDQARLLIETIDYLTKQILKKPNGIDLWIQLADTLADSDRLNNLIHICVEKIIQQCPLKEYFKVLISSSQTMLVRTILIGVIGQEFGLTYPKKMKGWYED